MKRVNLFHSTLKETAEIMNGTVTDPAEYGNMAAVTVTFPEIGESLSFGLTDTGEIHYTLPVGLAGVGACFILDLQDAGFILPEA